MRLTFRGGERGEGRRGGSGEGRECAEKFCEGKGNIYNNRSEW